MGGMSPNRSHWILLGLAVLGGIAVGWYTARPRPPRVSYEPAPLIDPVILEFADIHWDGKKGAASAPAVKTIPAGAPLRIAGTILADKPHLNAMVRVRLLDETNPPRTIVVQELGCQVVPQGRLDHPFAVEGHAPRGAGARILEVTLMTVDNPTPTVVGRFNVTITPPPP